MGKIKENYNGQSCKENRQESRPRCPQEKENRILRRLHLQSPQAGPPRDWHLQEVHEHKDRPCKVVDTSTSKTGKHGHAKVNMTALDIFTSKKYEDSCPSTHNMMVPNVSRTEYTLLDISDD